MPIIRDGENAREVLEKVAENVRSGVIDEITDPELAERYYDETGCDLIVANLGTEHRRTEGTVEYHRNEARKIAQRIGRKLALHGTSSLNQSDLSGLAEDGILKVNLWGRLESEPGKNWPGSSSGSLSISYHWIGLPH